jgi:hypothetical protein
MAWQPTRAQLKKNLKALRARLDERPMDLDARMRMARTHRLLGDDRQAINHYRSVARYLSLSGQPLGAIAVLKELLLVDPGHEETLLFLAKLYARTRSADATNTGRVAVPHPRRRHRPHRPARGAAEHRHRPVARHPAAEDRSLHRGAHP